MTKSFFFVNTAVNKSRFSIVTEPYRLKPVNQYHSGVHPIASLGVKRQAEASPPKYRYFGGRRGGQVDDDLAIAPEVVLQLQMKSVSDQYPTNTYTLLKPVPYRRFCNTPRISKYSTGKIRVIDYWHRFNNFFSYCQGWAGYNFIDRTATVMDDQQMVPDRLVSWHEVRVLRWVNQLIVSFQVQSLPDNLITKLDSHTSHNIERSKNPLSNNRYKSVTSHAGGVSTAKLRFHSASLIFSQKFYLSDQKIKIYNIFISPSEMFEVVPPTISEFLPWVGNKRKSSTPVDPDPMRTSPKGIPFRDVRMGSAKKHQDTLSTMGPGYVFMELKAIGDSIDLMKKRNTIFKTFILKTDHFVQPLMSNNIIPPSGSYYQTLDYTLQLKAHSFQAMYTVPSICVPIFREITSNWLPLNKLNPAYGYCPLRTSYTLLLPPEDVSSGGKIRDPRPQAGYANSQYTSGSPHPPNSRPIENFGSQGAKYEILDRRRGVRIINWPRIPTQLRIWCPRPKARLIGGEDMAHNRILLFQRSPFLTKYRGVKSKLWMGNSDSSFAMNPVGGVYPNSLITQLGIVKNRGSTYHKLSHADGSGLHLVFSSGLEKDTRKMCEKSYHSNIESSWCSPETVLPLYQLRKRLILKKRMNLTESLVRPYPDTVTCFLPEPTGEGTIVKIPTLPAELFPRQQICSFPLSISHQGYSSYGVLTPCGSTSTFLTKKRAKYAERENPAGGALRYTYRAEKKTPFFFREKKMLVSKTKMLYGPPHLNEGAGSTGGRSVFFSALALNHQSIKQPKTRVSLPPNDLFALFHQINFMQKVNGVTIRSFGFFGLQDQGVSSSRISSPIGINRSFIRSGLSQMCVLDGVRILERLRSQDWGSSYTQPTLATGYPIFTPIEQINHQDKSRLRGLMRMIDRYGRSIIWLLVRAKANISLNNLVCQTPPPVVLLQAKLWKEKLRVPNGKGGPGSLTLEGGMQTGGIYRLLERMINHRQGPFEFKPKILSSAFRPVGSPVVIANSTIRYPTNWLRKQAGFRLLTQNAIRKPVTSLSDPAYSNEYENKVQTQPENKWIGILARGSTGVRPWYPFSAPMLTTPVSPITFMLNGRGRPRRNLNPQSSLRRTIGLNTSQIDLATIRPKAEIPLVFRLWRLSCKSLAYYAPIITRSDVKKTAEPLYDWDMKQTVSESYLTLLKKAKILEDYPIPDPIYQNSTARYLSILNGGMPRFGLDLIFSKSTVDMRLMIPIGFRARPSTEPRLAKMFSSTSRKNFANYGSVTPINNSVPTSFPQAGTLAKPPYPTSNHLGELSTSEKLWGVTPEKANKPSGLNPDGLVRMLSRVPRQHSVVAFPGMKSSVEKTSINRRPNQFRVVSPPITELGEKRQAGPDSNKTAISLNSAIDGNMTIKRREPILQESRSYSTASSGRNLRKLRLQYLRNFRRLRFIEYLKATYIKPEWMILSLLPVLPPDLRPVIANPRGYITGDINTHYQNVIYRNNNIEKLLDTFWIPRKFYSKTSFSDLADLVSMQAADRLPINIGRRTHYMFHSGKEHVRVIGLPSDKLYFFEGSRILPPEDAIIDPLRTSYTLLLPPEDVSSGGKIRDPRPQAGYANSQLGRDYRPIENFGPQESKYGSNNRRRGMQILNRQGRLKIWCPRPKARSEWGEGLGTRDQPGMVKKRGYGPYKIEAPPKMVPFMESKTIRTQVLHDSKPLQEMQYSLQKAVDALMDNSQKLQSNILLRKGRPLKSLSDNLKGKEGRFRQHLLGKRVDYSGRSVIVVGPDLKLYECGIPLIMALRLFQPFLILYLIYRFKIASLLATQLIQRKHPMVINLLKRFIETWPVLLNRAPTLHRMNIQAFKIRLVQGKAILLHPLVCSSYNADFDGDQMGVHVPITQQARAESWKLLWSINNSIAIASRQPLFLPSQDMVIGNYYLTQDPIILNRYATSPHQQHLLISDLAGKKMDNQVRPLFLNEPPSLSKGTKWNSDTLYIPSTNNRANSSYLTPWVKGEETIGASGLYQSSTTNMVKQFSPYSIASPVSLPFGNRNSDPWVWLQPAYSRILTNHYFFSIQQAYQYYLNTAYRFHVNTPVWFRCDMVFETSEREKPIEITLDKSGNSIYIARYYEKQLKRNRVLKPNHFDPTAYIQSIPTSSMVIAPSYCGPVGHTHPPFGLGNCPFGPNSQSGLPIENSHTPPTVEDPVFCSLRTNPQEAITQYSLFRRDKIRGQLPSPQGPITKLYFLEESRILPPEDASSGGNNRRRGMRILNWVGILGRLRIRSEWTKTPFNKRDTSMNENKTNTQYRNRSSGNTVSGRMGWTPLLGNNKLISPHSKIIGLSHETNFNRNLNPICLNQIIRSTFGRIEFYYEAFSAAAS